MTHDNTPHFDEISRFLKKIEWPAPDRTLGERIIDQMISCNGTRMIGLSQQQPSIWFYKSPFITVIAVILSLFLGLASGFVTSHKADAMDANTVNSYDGTAVSVTNIYLGKISSHNQ